jgi:hypothetical protein
MKTLTKILLAASMALSGQFVIAEEPKTRTVCVDVKDKDGKPVKDSKTGKTKQSCKEVKVHQKLEGNKVPDKK